MEPKLRMDNFEFDQALRKLGYSDWQAASALGYTDQTIRRWRNGPGFNDFHSSGRIPELVSRVLRLAVTDPTVLRRLSDHASSEFEHIEIDGEQFIKYSDGRIMKLDQTSTPIQLGP